MHKTITAALTFTLFILPLAVNAERISLDQVPTAVIDGFREKHPEARDLEVDKESHFGFTLYEVKFKESGHNEHQSLFDSEGKPFGHEESLKPDDLPPEVTASLTRLFTSVTIKDAEKITHPDGSQSEYEIDLEADGADWEIKMDPKGNVLSKEKD